MGKWIISLSNGETIIENSERLNELYSDNRSTYQKLLQYMKENNLLIRSIRIQVNGRTHTFSISPKGKFPTFIEVKDIGYRRKFTMNSNGEKEEFINYYIIIGNIKMMMWIDENSGDSWMQCEEVIG